MFPRINVFGDFKIDNVSNLRIGDNLCQLLQKGGINLLNFEAPIIDESCSSIAKSGPSISQDACAPTWVEKHGWNVISLANNHAYDYGQRGLQLTINAFSSAAIIGGGENPYRVTYKKVGDIIYSFIAVTQHEYGVVSSNGQWGTAGMSNPCVDSLILEAKKHSDFLLVYPHAGVERVNYPLPELRSLYRHWIDIGANAVLASHPHIPQGWETYKESPIFYSLGNFAFDDTDELPWWYDSLVVSLYPDSGKLKADIYTCHYNQAGGMVEISEIIPQAFKVRLNTLCEIMKDERRYLVEVNNYCRTLLPFFQWSISSAGLSTSHKKKVLKRILRRKNNSTPVHLLNLLQCESHRWALMRILNAQS